jgi:hypothetical protein
MDFTEFKKKLRGLPLISSRDLEVFKENNPALRNQLVRWQKKGLLAQLRRGLYILNETDRKLTPSLSFLANRLYEPSYISLEYALSRYGFIPEQAVDVTSVSTRKPTRFHNDFGSFFYQQVKPQAFRGFSAAKDSSGLPFLIAEPEKALLDFFYLNLGKFYGLGPGVFKGSFRFQNMEGLRKTRLLALARFYSNKKLSRVAKEFCAFLSKEKRK